MTPLQRLACLRDKTKVVHNKSNQIMLTQYIASTSSKRLPSPSLLDTNAPKRQAWGNKPENAHPPPPSSVSQDVDIDMSQSEKSKVENANENEASTKSSQTDCKNKSGSEASNSELEDVDSQSAGSNKGSDNENSQASEVSLEGEELSDASNGKTGEHQMNTSACELIHWHQGYLLAIHTVLEGLGI
jgi:hypothetical protein